MLLEPLAEGVLLEPLDDGVLLEPLDAPLLGEVGEALLEPLDDEDGELGVVAEPDAEPELDGELGEVLLEPEDEDEPAPGVVAERSPPALSPHAVSRLAPNAMEIATARVLSFISGPPWVGCETTGARLGPIALRS